jgi:hypothetical protein
MTLNGIPYLVLVALGRVDVSEPRVERECNRTHRSGVIVLPGPAQREQSKVAW